MKVPKDWQEGWKMSAILTQYIEGLIDRRQAIAKLKILGYRADVAVWLVDDARREKREWNS
jgi:hypothetical protein